MTEQNPARVAFVDLPEPKTYDGAQEPPFGRGPIHVASPALLCRVAEARAVGVHATYHHLGVVDDATREALRAASRIVVRAAAVKPDEARSRLVSLVGEPASGGAIEIFDPFAAPRALSVMPAYDAARGQNVTHAEAEVAPAGEPLHPWAAPSLSTVPPEMVAERTRIAIEAQAGAPSAQVHLNDERARIDMDRLRALADVVRGSLRDHRTLVDLHVRAWPEDLLGERVLDHLSLLPVASLDLLVGSLYPPSLRAMGSPLSVEDLTRFGAEVMRAGLAHLARVSVVLGLPGETAEHCLAIVNETFRLALASRVSRMRFSLWLGDSAPPADASERKRRFLASHPDWHEVEYQGIQDYIAVSALTYPYVKIVGPDD